MSDIYDLVRRADGQKVASFPNNGRWQIFTNAGIVSVRPLLEEEILITPRWDDPVFTALWVSGN